MRRARRAAMALCAALAAALTGVLGAAEERIAPETPLWNAVGRVNLAGYRTTSHCTGTLIAPDAVLTASHCVRAPRATRPALPDQIHFLAGARRGAHVAHRRARCVLTLDDPTTIDLSTDAAVIRLERPITEAAPFAVAGDAPPIGTALEMVGYPRHRPHAPSLQTCRLLQVSGGLWLTSCAANFGGSGGPVLRRDGDGAPEIAAILVARRQDGRGIALGHAAWEALLSRDCPASDSG